MIGYLLTFILAALTFVLAGAAVQSLLARRVQIPVRSSQDRLSLTESTDV